MMKVSMTNILYLITLLLLMGFFLMKSLRRQEINRCINELKEAVNSDSFSLELSEEGILLLEKKLSDDFQEGRIDLDFFRKYRMNLTYYIGEVFINQYGGKWIFPLKTTIFGKLDYPDGIRCTNGDIDRGFIVILYEVIEDELDQTAYFSLNAAYHAINIEYSGKKKE